MKLEKTRVDNGNQSLADVPVVILAGGKGLFIDDTGIRKSKGEVQVSGKAMMAHVLKIYLASGFRKFIVSGGYRMEHQIEELKRTYSMMQLEPNHFYSTSAIKFSVQFVDSGVDTVTGERLLQLKDMLTNVPRFCMTYSDTISTVNIRQLYNWHLKNKKTVTLLAAKLPTRFRVLGIRSGESKIRGFADKTFMPTHAINGGFYVIESSIWSYFKAVEKKPVFEKHILELLMEKGELESFSFSGPWQYIDSERDLIGLEQIAQQIETAAY